MTTTYLENYTPSDSAEEPGAEGLAAVPMEQSGSVPFGVLLHFGPSAALILTAAATGMAPVPTLVGFLVASGVATGTLLWAEEKSPSVALDRPSAIEKVKGLAHAFGVAMILGTSVVVAGFWLLQRLGGWQSGLSPWISIPLAVAFSDLLYYGLHRFLNHGRTRSPLVRWFKRSHSKHHSVTKLDFYRGIISSVMDTGVVGFQLPVLASAAVLGMDLPSTLLAYALLLLLEGVHHANHAVDIGQLRYLFLDNHAHQMHHCPRGNLVNHGVIFSVWDRLFGTYYEDRRLSPAYMVRHHVALPIVPAWRH